MTERTLTLTHAAHGLALRLSLSHGTRASPASPATKLQQIAFATLGVLGVVAAMRMSGLVEDISRAGQQVALADISFGVLGVVAAMLMGCFLFLVENIGRAGEQVAAVGLGPGSWLGLVDGVNLHSGLPWPILVLCVMACK